MEGNQDGTWSIESELQRENQGYKSSYNGKEKKRDMVTTSKFLNEINYVKREDFTEISRERSMSDHNKPLSKEHVRKNVKKYFYSNRVVNDRNKLSDETVSADLLQKLKNL